MSQELAEYDFGAGGTPESVVIVGVWLISFPGWDTFGPRARRTTTDSARLMMTHGFLANGEKSSPRQDFRREALHCREVGLCNDDAQCFSLHAESKARQTHIPVSVEFFPC
jgi:hypothetical protein